jgi:copper resistance protein B
MGKSILTALCLLVGLHQSAVMAGEMAHAHMNDDPLVGMVLVDHLEWQNASPDDALAWKVAAWTGRDAGRLLVRSDGEMINGDVEEARAELLWSKPIAAWWDLVGGLRQDFGPGPGQTYGLVGVQGTAPYRFHIEADLFGGERGQVGIRVESDYELLLTNQWILVPQAELQAFGKDDADLRVGSGLSQLELGLRLRYEIRREFAPYVGVEWSGKFGDTADFAEEADESVRDTRFVAGLRFWF